MMVKKTPPLDIRFWSKVNIKTVDECWPWLAYKMKPARDYGVFSIKHKPCLAHRMSWILTNGDIPDGLCVLHKCDNPQCCNPNHLFLGTNLENVADKVSKKRHMHGENIITSKLTDKIVKTILSQKPEGRAPYGYCKRIANEYNISTSKLSEIWRGERWKHVQI